MKKIRLFSAKATKDVEGSEAELYVNFYLVLNKDYIFTFLIESPDLACSGRNPIKLWKRFLILFEEESVKYLRRYEKAQYIYINCLKTDLVAVLKELQLEIEEHEESIIGQYSKETKESDFPSHKIERNCGRKECVDLIQQKIDALKAESEVNRWLG